MPSKHHRHPIPAFVAKTAGPVLQRTPASKLADQPPGLRVLPVLASAAVTMLLASRKTS